jgi:hypothetical protein
VLAIGPCAIAVLVSLTAEWPRRRGVGVLAESEWLARDVNPVVLLACLASGEGGRLLPQ